MFKAVYCPFRSPRKFLKLFLPPALMIIAWAFSFYHQETRRLIEIRKQDEVFRSERATNIIEDRFEDINHEILFIIHQFDEHGVDTYLEDGLLEKAWVGYAEIMGYYQQIRWIGLDGMEKVRFEYGSQGPSIVPMDDLQNKSDRYYFKESVNLPAETIYVSPLDLNIEKGEIEEPRNPTIRLASPLEAEDGSRHGVVVLNYYANELLDRLASVTPLDPVWLLNDKGYWLKGPSADQEWGFMYDRDDLTMEKKYPAVWKRIMENGDGQFSSEDGLWTFHTVYPLRAANIGLSRSAIRLVDQKTDYFWKVVSFMPAEKLFADFANLRALLGLFVFLLLTTSFIGTMLICQAQTRAAAARDELIKTVEQLDVRNRQLDAAKEEAERATRVKADFLANMSHELRTPLNAVVGMTELLMNCKLESEARDCAKIINASSESLVQLINDILDFSKIESGKLNIEQHDFDLVECVEGTLDLLHFQAANKDIELTCDIGENVPAIVNGDLVRIRQILLNLLSNAIKFTGKGEVAVSVDAKAIDCGYELLFEVRDTGIGIDEGQVKKIFQAFTQADSSTTRKFGGTGLGLTISRNLCELMQGKIWVESKQGEGSSFYFTIRAGKAENETLQPRELLHFPAGLENILIVDDNETNLRIISSQLSRWGLNPCTFQHPHEALKSIERGDLYAMMICDMQMPEMDGAMLISEIRKLRNPEELPILMLTSVGGDMSNELDVFASLPKPVKIELLHSTIASVLGGEEKADERTGIPNESVELEALDVLVVEDNRLNQEVMKRLLRKLKIEADFAEDGVEALAKVEKKEYDLIFMDVQMPRMDGYEATQKLIAQYDRECKRPRIVGMSAHAMEEHRTRALECGMDDYITKPIEFNLLKKTIFEACSA